MTREPEGFREFVLAASPGLTRTAYFLTGDAALADDLVQEALARTWPHWHRIRDGNPHAYVRRVMVRQQGHWLRRRWRGEVPTQRLPETAAPPAGVDGFAERDDLRVALLRLPVAQRQAIVLRYVEDRGVDEVAQILGCSVGTVKSRSARGLAALRARLEQGGPGASERRDGVTWTSGT